MPSAATIILAAFGVASGAVCAYAVARFPVAVTPFQLGVYYVLPLLAAALAFVMLRREEEQRINIALVVVSASVSLLVAEVGLALLAPTSVPEDVARMTGRPLDRRRRSVVARDLADNGTVAYPHLAASHARELRLPVGEEEFLWLAPGLPNTTTIFCRDNGSWLTYLSDEHGFNNDPGSWQDVEVVLIGDSFAHGFCVPREKSIAGVLRRAWPRTLNLGTSGAGPLTGLAILREFAADLRPPVVLWLYYEGNDLWDAVEEMTDPILVRYLDDRFRQRIPERKARLHGALRARLDAMLAARQFEDDPGLDDRLNGWRILRLKRLQSLLFGAPVPFPSSVSRVAPTGRILEQARDAVDAWEGRLYLVYLPWFPRYNGWVEDMGIERQELLDLMEDLGIPVIDVAGAFSSLEDPRSLWLHPAGHYSSAGYRLVAETILDQVALPPHGPFTH